MVLERYSNIIAINMIITKKLHFRLKSEQSTTYMIASDSKNSNFQFYRCLLDPEQSYTIYFY